MENSSQSNASLSTTCEQQVKKPVSHEEASKMIKETMKQLEETMKRCQETIRITKETQKTCQETRENIDDFKNKFKEVLDKMVNNFAAGLQASDAISNTEKYGTANVVDIKQAAQILSKQNHFIFLTGAGISVASGIRPYRGQGSVQGLEKDGKFYKNEELATNAFMKSNPEIFFERHVDFHEIAKKCKPNDGHLSIAKFMKQLNSNKQYKSTLITQNIDDLHVQANNIVNKQKQPKQKLQMNPNDSIYQIHGNIKYFRCEENCCNDIYEIDITQLGKEKQQPTCKICQKSLSRPNVLYFDEAYNQENYSIDSLKERIELGQHQAQAFKDSKICLIVIGTTLETNMARKIVSTFVENEKIVLEINRDDLIIKSGKGTYGLQGNSEKILPQLLDILQSQLKK